MKTLAVSLTKGRKLWNLGGMWECQSSGEEHEGQESGGLLAEEKVGRQPAGPQLSQLVHQIFGKGSVKLQV